MPPTAANSRVLGTEFCATPRGELAFVRQTAWASFVFSMGETMKKSAISALAVAASLGLFASLGGAKAADLGGGCCADLEERVAELEATTARKGNRAVSLTISGQVTKQLLIWDDGVDSDVYITDNSILNSQFSLNGKARIAPGLTAGYLLQVNVANGGSNFVHQGSSENPASVGDITLRNNNLYIESKRLGTITLGHGYSLNDKTHVSALFPVAWTYQTDGTPYSDNFRIMNTTGTSSGIAWGQLVGFGPRRGDYVRYDSPSIGGFRLTALAGENDVWNVGVSYVGKVGNFLVSGAADYYSYDDTALGAAGFLSKFDDTSGVFAAKHLPTGLFATVWATQRDYTRTNFTPGGAPLSKTANGVSFDDSGHSLYGMVGVEKKLLPYGKTTVYGHYGRFVNMAGTGLSAAGLGQAVNGLSGDDYVANAEVTRYGIGIVQSFDSAGLDIFAMAERNSADITVGDMNGSTIDAAAGTKKADLEDWTGIMIGSRIKF